MCYTDVLECIHFSKAPKRKTCQHLLTSTNHCGSLQFNHFYTRLTTTDPCNSTTSIQGKRNYLPEKVDSTCPQQLANKKEIIRMTHTHLRILTHTAERRLRSTPTEGPHQLSGINLANLEMNLVDAPSPLGENRGLQICTNDQLNTPFTSPAALSTHVDRTDHVTNQQLHEEILSDLHDVRMKYVNVPDPVEREERHQRVLEGETHNEMAETTASLLAQALKSTNNTTITTVNATVNTTASNNAFMLLWKLKEISVLQKMNLYARR
ncbi:unnamed protein product [Eruca vesicaria subsp. sativa]|uniref:Uncharacterized protein n=1 Tax=Eruca vesicaria subsp. sativa TaxID=29727 RepID=A0ABC8KLD6_ERUVS|nr:unnamed protein product [Eruca vesicaria subsp. sativa]